jgi:hypothetical protein
VTNGAKFDRERNQHQGPVIDEHGNPIAAPPNQHRPPWRGRMSSLQRAMMGGDDD